MHNPRKVHRLRTYLGAQVAFNNGYFSTPCLVRELSEAGAKIEFAHPTLLPSEFELTISKTGATRRVRIVSQARQMAFCVSFLAPGLNL
jgi:hypothetical protein